MTYLDFRTAGVNPLGSKAIWIFGLLNLFVAQVFSVSLTYKPEDKPKLPSYVGNRIG
jgi:hypothetical protein